MRIAIIFISDKWDASYSLSSVVTSQINSFVNYNCELRVITKKECPNWKFSDKFDYRPCLSSFEFNPRKKPEKRLRNNNHHGNNTRMPNTDPEPTHHRF